MFDTSYQLELLRLRNRWWLPWMLAGSPEQKSLQQLHPPTNSDFLLYNQVCMKFTITTCVWGSWHTDMMAQVMLPTLLAPGNLPALCEKFDVTYRISTTPRDCDIISELPALRDLRTYCQVELVCATEISDPGAIHHVKWYHQAIADARNAGSMVALVPPDVAWSSNTFGNMARHMAAGRLATAMPYLRVVSETAIPALKAKIASDGILDIAPGDLVRFGVEHLHPLTAVATDGGRHGRPSLEMLWRVPGEGLLLRHMVRELSSFDPSRLSVTHFWYADQVGDESLVHNVTDSDDMLMLSFAPLMKDIPLYLHQHKIDGFDIARSSLHPLNDTPLNPYFAKHYTRLHYGRMTESVWRRTERRSDAVFKNALVGRSAMQIWKAIGETGGCSIAAQLLAVGLLGTLLARRWHSISKGTILIPTDAAFSKAPKPWWYLLDETRMADLRQWLSRHVVAREPEFPPASFLKRQKLGDFDLVFLNSMPFDLP